MKLQKMIMAFILLILIAGLNASVRLNSLGNYFYYLIPDLETDSELFAGYLMDYENKYFQITNEPTNNELTKKQELNLSYLPITGKFRMKFDVNTSSNNYDSNFFLDDFDLDYFNHNVDYLTSYENSSAFVKSTFAYELGNLILGGYLQYGRNWGDEVNFDSRVEYIPILKQVDYELNEDIIEAALNLRFNNLDFTIGYGNNEADFKSLSDVENENYNMYDPDQFSYEINHYNSQVEKENKNYFLAIMKNIKKENSQIRFYGKVAYADIEIDQMLEQSYFDSTYTPEASNYIYIRDDGFCESRTEDLKRYQGAIGMAKSNYNKLIDLHYGWKILAEYNQADRFISFSEYRTRTNVYIDTTETTNFTYEESNDFEVSGYKAELQIPFGIVTHLSSKIDILGGLGASLQYAYIDYFDTDDKSLDINVSKNLGLSYRPLESCVIDLSFRNNFTTFSSWNASIKYFW